MESLEFQAEPDYNKCRKMFEIALKAAGCKLDGKIDFSTPKKAPKKVRTSSPRKRKSAVLVSDEDTADSDTDESFAKEKSVKKRKSPVAGTSKTPVPKPRTKKAAMSPEKSVKKTTVTKSKALMKDQGCQTSPGFVKAVKAARKKKPVQNVEMDEFVKESISAAKKAVKKTPVKKTPAKKSPKKTPAVKAKTENGNGEAALSNLTNLTPAMLAVMAKKAENSSAKKPRTKK